MVFGRRSRVLNALRTAGQQPIMAHGDEKTTGYM